MTRIISGQYKGRSLTVPPSVTRPTSSRVREAVFSSVQHFFGDLAGINVLDLFAGSGALGLEALSRGASSCLWVERDSVAITCINQNAKQLGETKGQAISGEVSTIVSTTSTFAKFDLVFLDPPYSIADEQISSILGNLAKNQWLAPESLLVIERGRRSEVQWPIGFAAQSNKNYGDTSIWYGMYLTDKVELSEK